MKRGISLDDDSANATQAKSNTDSERKSVNISNNKKQDPSNSNKKSTSSSTTKQNVEKQSITTTNTNNNNNKQQNTNGISTFGINLIEYAINQVGFIEN